MFESFKIIVLVASFVAYNACESSYLQRLALPVAAVSVAVYQANKVADCNGSSSEVNSAIFGIHKSASDFVRGPLDHSVTKWRRSSDWKNKIWAPNAHEDTEFRGDQIDGFGHGSFSMQRQGDKLHVRSEIVTKDVMGASRQNGLNITIGGINIAMHSGTFKFEQSDLFTKCVHTIQIGKKPVSKLNKVGDIITNRPSCDNPYCKNKDCLRLREQAALCDTISVVSAVAFEDNAPRVVRTSNCTSVFPINEVSSSW